jgi:PEP-CTERM motif-containing protein
MFRLSIGVAGISLLSLFSGAAPAQVIGFENFAPPGGLVNINPTMPYTEAGFQFLPSNSSSAVFDVASATTMLGNPSSWFGFAASNTITLTRLSGPPFSLTSLLAGPSSIAQGNPITLTLVGNVAGGGTLNASFPNLTTATLENLNWTNLSSVTLSSTSDAGIDNVSVSGVPEPTSLIFVGFGLLVETVRRRRKVITK